MRYACVQYSTRTGPEHGLRTPYGAGCTARIYIGACALHFSRVYVRYGFRLGQSEQCNLYVHVCVYGGRHVQPERCTTRREYVCACVVQYMAWTAWAVCVVYTSACACTYVLCLYHLHSVLYTCTVFWRGQPGQCTYLARVRELLVPHLVWTAGVMHVVYMSACACTYVLCLYHLHSVLDHLHSVLVWAARAMYQSCLRA